MRDDEGWCGVRDDGEMVRGGEVCVMVRDGVG